MKKVFLLFITFLPACCSSQWMNLDSPHFNETAVSGNSILGVEEQSGIYLSTNNGNSWLQTSLNISGFIKIAVEGNNIFAGTIKQENRGIFRSTNSGLNWEHMLSPVELYAITCIAISGENIFTSTGRAIYHSTNNGNNWIQTSVPFFVYSFAINGSNIFAGVEATGVMLSTNNGISWSQTSLNNSNVLSVRINGSNIFAGTETGVYLSTNNGASWTQTTLNNRYVSSLAVSGTNIFAGTDAGVYISKDNGRTWTQKNQGMSGDILDGPHLTASANFVFASNSGVNTWRRELSDIISVHQISTTLPVEFKLEQNFPNPFNPSTQIIFSIPFASSVALKIFDLTGKEIAALLNEKLNAGTYQYQFNANNLPSGIYFYRIETENYSATKSMILLK